MQFDYSVLKNEKLILKIAAVLIVFSILCVYGYVKFISDFCDVPNTLIFIISLLLLVMYPLRLVIVYPGFILKYLSVFVGLVLVILFFTNPSENSFQHYAETHAPRKKHSVVRTNRERNYVILSIFYTKGRSKEGYYIGMLGGFYFWEGQVIENISYIEPPYEEDSDE